VSQKLAKVSASPQADEALNRMLERVNDLYDGGRVAKSELLTWIVLRFESTSFANSIKAIRKAYFDDVAFCEQLLLKVKRARRDGASDEEVATLLDLLKKPGNKSAVARKSLSLSSEPN